MFFLLGDSSTTLVETIVKLLVVILVSSLIIYLCYKLANFRKSKRSKPICFTFNRDPIRQVSALTIGSDPASNSQQFQRLLYCLRPGVAAGAGLEHSPSRHSISAHFYPQSPAATNEPQQQNNQDLTNRPGLIVSFNDYINRRLLNQLSGEPQFQIQPHVGANFNPDPIYFPPTSNPNLYHAPASPTDQEPKPPCPSYQEAIASEYYPPNVAAGSSSLAQNRPPQPETSAD